MAETTAFKVVVNGDPAVGKTSLVLRYANDQFVQEYIPNVYDNMVVEQVIDGHNYTITIIDSGGSEDFDRIRPLSYGNTSAFVVMFSIVAPQTFDSARTKWKPEITEHAPNTPIILVGGKVDLVNDPETLQRLENKGQKPVTREQAEVMKKEIGALAYIETSAVTGLNVKEVFEACVISVHSNAEGKDRCVVC